MLIGIGLGFYSTYLSAKDYSDSKPAADAFADFWGDSADFDLQAPPDLPAEDLPALDAAP